MHLKHFPLDDQFYMQRCLQLARLGKGHVSPNPMVGAVLVHNDRIIGEGYHQKYGEAHAEVNCINSVGNTDKYLIQESTLYVSLEPCAHYGKTAPCSLLILQNKIPRVVVGCKDDFEKVSGKGIDQLRASGVDVRVGILEQECREMNRRFFVFHNQKRPYIILKWAQSMDGIIGAHQTRVAISNDYTNRMVHQWRGEEDAILVGAQTALTDNPELTNRLWTGKNPLRLLIDPNLKVPATAKIFNEQSDTIVFNRIHDGENMNVRHIQLIDDYFLPEILHHLFQMNIQSVIIEGGAYTLQQYIDADLWDECRIITNTSLRLFDGISAPQLHDGKLKKEQNIEGDIIQFYQNKNQ